MAFLKRNPDRGQVCLVVVLWAVIVSFYASAATADIKVADLPKKAIKALYLGQQALQEKNFDKTIQVLTDYMAQAEEPIPLPVFQMLGYVYYQKPDPVNARKTFGAAHKRFPQNPEMLQNYAILTYEAGHLIEAAGLFEKLYRLKNKSEKEILYQAAGIYFQAENLQEAKRVLGELLASGGEANPKWYEDMIALCVETKKWNEAEKWAKEFLELQPHRSEYWRLLAQIGLDREAYRSAASALEIAYRLKKPRKSEWLELADLYLYLNAPLMAIRCMETGFGNESPYDKQLKIARIYARSMRFDKAIAKVNEAYRKSPTADVMLEKGRLLYDAMRYAEAIKALETCVKIDPKQGEAWVLIGFAAWNLKQWDKARSAFASASTLPKCREQANDAVAVLDDLMEAFKRTTENDP